MANPKIIFILESPPASGKYFYNPEGAVSEPLFRAMMKDVLEITPASKEKGLKEFAERGFLLLDATYAPVNHLSDREKDTTILREFPALLESLREYAKLETSIVLVKANVCDLLEPKLRAAGFNVLNCGTMIPFPTFGQQTKFTTAIREVFSQNTK